ncbi:MAG TPA: ABC transporter permease [Solirubrobacteraceae bacterium]
MAAVPDVLTTPGAPPVPPIVPAVPAGTRHPIAQFVARRLATGLLTLLVVTVLIFLATNILPGNAATVVLGRNATPARVQRLDERLNVDHSVLWRYTHWLGNAVQGDFGNSAIAEAESRPNASISSSIGSPLRNSFILAGLTTILLIPLTLVLGTLAGIFAGRRLDNAISFPALVMGGLPEFVMGTLLIYIFFDKLHWLPPVALLSPGESPFSNPEALVLPILTLLAVAVGAGVRQVRAGMADVLQREYVHFARLNGVSNRRVLYAYALRNALAPSVQIIAQNLQYLVGGIIIVESVFAYPGIGTYLVNAVTSRDVTEVQAAASVLAALYIVINLLADLAVVLLVPKLRTGDAR